MMKKICALALALMLVLCFGVVGFAAQYPLAVDEAEVLGSAELEILEDYLQEISDASGFDVVVYYASDLHGREAQALADDFYDYNGYGRGVNKDGMILMICPSARKYAFSTTGLCYDLINGERFDQMESDAVAYMKAGDWFNAGISFAVLAEQFAQEGMPEDRQDEQSGMANPFFLLPFSLISGFVFSFIPSSIQKGKLKSVAQQTRADYYVAENGVRIAVAEDQLVNHLVTSRPISNSSSGDGGRGTHIGSSGTSHGGRSGSF